MKHKKTLLCSLLLISCLILVTSMPVFAAELTEAEVQQAVDAQGKETVTGNVFIWFLCAIAFLKVSQKIDSFMANRTEEKAIFVDEVWQLIGASSNRLAAEFVLEIAKIIRAYSGAGIFATQDLNDFFALDDGKYGKGIINNCKTKIILNMEDEEAQRVKTILRLSETEVMNITHFQRGNGLISTNNNNITVEFKASNLEKELITTDRQELLEILKRQDKKVG